MTDGTSRPVPEIPDIDLGPKGSTLRDDVAQGLESAGDWQGLADHLRNRMQEDTPHARDIAAKLSEVLEERLDMPAEAAKVFTWVLERTPGDALAIRELERLYGEMEDWDGLVQAFRMGIEATTDVFAKTAMLEKIRMIQHEALGDTEGMRTTCLKALELVPRCAWAWVALETSHAEDESWWELVHALTEVAVRAGQRVAGEHEADGANLNVGMITLHIAEIMDERLGQADKAIALYEASIREGANALDALYALSNLYAEAENWTQLVYTYKRLAPLTKGQAEEATLRRNCAMVLADGLGDVDGAIAIYEALLEEDPNDEASSEALQALQQRES